MCPCTACTASLLPVLPSCLRVQGCFHALKLRHSVKVDPRTRMELGLDLEIVEGHHLKDMLKNASPWAAVLHQVASRNPAPLPWSPG